MIDNIKIYILDKEKFEQSIKALPVVSLKGSYDSVTGEAKEYPLKGKLYNLDIVISEKVAFVSGSIHKYYNSLIGLEEGNYNDFSMCDFKMGINSLCETLKIKPSRTKITNLEFGFNININEPPYKLIENQVIMFNYKEANRVSSFRGRGCFKEFKMSDYSLKIYDKSKQYRISRDNILRIEQKITSSRFLRNKGIFNLEDINKKTLNTLYVSLFKLVEKLTLVDDTEPPTALRLDKKMLFLNGLNPSYWRSEKVKGGFSLLKRDFEKIVNEYGLNANKFQIMESIRLKYKELLYCQDEIKAA